MMMVSAAYLEPLNGTDKRTIPLTAEGLWRVGRGKHNDIDLPGGMVSRNHAVIQGVGDGLFYLSDLGSQNGTYANRKPLSSPILLREGDVISIGDYSFCFHMLERTAEEPVLDETLDETYQRTAVRLMMKVITVMVVDFRGFTDIATEINAVQLAQMMSSYFQQAGDVLLARGAWAQKYIGDAVMAVWVHEPDQTAGTPLLAAVDALIAMQSIARGLQRRFGLKNPVRISAGINTGLASLGNLGSGSHSDYTALGETVIRAFRMEKVTRALGCEVVAGVDAATALERLAGHPFLKESTTNLKGFTDLCQIFETNIEVLQRELQRADYPITARAKDLRGTPGGESR